MPDIVARPLSPQALSKLLERKPHLLRPLVAQLLPPRTALDPLVRLGINLSSVQATEDVLLVLRKTWAALSRGEIAPSQALHIARRLRRHMRALRRLTRLQTQTK